MAKKRIELKDLRRKLREIGHKVKTESLSWGRHITYTNADGVPFSGNVFSADSIKRWEPLISCLKSLSEEYDGADDKGDKLYGSLLKLD